MYLKKKIEEKKGKKKLSAQEFAINDIFAIFVGRRMLSGRQRSKNFRYFGI